MLDIPVTKPVTAYVNEYFAGRQLLIDKEILDNPFVQTATVLIGRKHKLASRFFHFLYRELPDAFYTPLPFAIPCANDPTRLTVYPEVISRWHKGFEQYNYVISKDVLQELHTRQRAEAIAAKTEQKWGTPERARKLALRHLQTTIGRYVTTYTRAQERMKDDEIRAMVQRISSELQPLEIVVCQSPSDYVKMFSVKTQSCMQVGGQYYQEGTQARKLLDHMLERGVWPASWYHFTPHSKGVYFKKGKDIVARAMIYRDDLCHLRYPFYGDIRGESYAYMDKARDALEKAGYTRYNKRATTKEAFDIPAFHGGEDWGYVCPLPHCDNQEKDFAFTYDKEAHTFTFWPFDKAPRNARAVTYTYTWQGYILADTCEMQLHPCLERMKCQTPSIKTKVA